MTITTIIMIIITVIFMTVNIVIITVIIITTMMMMMVMMMMIIVVLLLLLSYPSCEFICSFFVGLRIYTTKDWTKHWLIQEHHQYYLNPKP